MRDPVRRYDGCRRTTGGDSEVVDDRGRLRDEYGVYSGIHNCGRWVGVWTWIATMKQNSMCKVCVRCKRHVIFSVATAKI